MPGDSYQSDVRWPALLELDGGALVVNWTWLHRRNGAAAHLPRPGNVRHAPRRQRVEAPLSSGSVSGDITPEGSEKISRPVNWGAANDCHRQVRWFHRD